MRAITLLLCDNRQPLTTTPLSADSLPALALKRHRMRKYAADEEIRLEGEVLIELEKGIDFDFLIDRTIHQIAQHDADVVICPDLRSLHEAGLLPALEARLPEHTTLLMPV